MGETKGPFPWVLVVLYALGIAGVVAVLAGLSIGLAILFAL